MNVIELWPFGKGLGQAWSERGHQVVVMDFGDNTRRGGSVPGELVTVEQVRAHDEAFRARFSGLTPRFDVVLARPFCPTYSPAARFMHYRDTVTGAPLKPEAFEADEIVKGQLVFIEAVAPRLGWAMENPHGDLRKCEFMRPIPVRTVTLCQYGDPMRKATDLFGPIPASFVPRACKVGATDHLKSDWSDKTKGDALKKLRKTSWERAWLPHQLSLELCLAFEAADAGMPR